MIVVAIHKRMFLQFHNGGYKEIVGTMKSDIPPTHMARMQRNDKREGNAEKSFMHISFGDVDVRKASRDRELHSC